MPATVAYRSNTQAPRQQHLHTIRKAARRITRSAVFSTPLVQAKLRIGAPNDRFEQEADHVADKVLRMQESGSDTPPASEFPAPVSPQRKCSFCSSSVGLCPECTEEEKLRQQPVRGASGPSGERAAASSEPPIAPPIVHEVLGSLGQPLDLPTRSFMEPRFQYDFSQVRVHADQRAAESAHDLHALAYTVGREVIFGAGQYSPSTDPGKKLLAHELTHVVQQGGASIRSGTVLPMGTPRQPLERQAGATAQAPVGSVSAVPSAALNSLTIQRTVTQQGTGKTGRPTPKDKRCAGWFADHESTSKRAAEHYVRTELAGNRGKGEKIDCDLFFPATGIFACTVHFTDGTRIRVLVRKDVIIVGVYPIKSLRPPSEQPLCWYDYSCPGLRQDLVLTRRKCQTAKTAGGTSKGRGPQP